MLRESLATLPVEVDVDEAGNLWAMLPGERPEMLVVGSHLDSVPKDGWLAGKLASILADSRRAAAEGCTVEWEHIFRIPPMPFHPALLDAARESVREVEGHEVELPSGALR